MLCVGGMSAALIVLCVWYECCCHPAASVMSAAVIML